MKNDIRKFTLALVILLVCSAAAFAHPADSTRLASDKTIRGLSGLGYQKGDKVLMAGVGIGNTFIDAGLNSKLPPVGLTFDYGITDKFSAGGYAGIATASQGFHSSGTTTTYRFRYFLFTGRGSYHFFTRERLDPYAGIALGYNAVSSSTSGPNYGTVSSTAEGAIWGIYLGARYSFHEQYGVFAELGTTIAYLSLGGSYRF
jgi:outer membrane protein W